MPITLDKLLGAYKQRISMIKTGSTTVTAGLPSTMIDRAGFPVAGALNPNQTTNGIVPVDTTAGYPLIEAPTGSNKLYLSKVGVSFQQTGTVEIFDCLFQAGHTVIPNSGTTTTVNLTSIPSFATRVPYMVDGITRDWQCVQLFVGISVAGSAHNHTTSIIYNDQDGNTGTTGNISTNNVAVNRLQRCALAAGDTGVQAITGYNVNGATSSTGNVFVSAMRSLGKYRSQGGISSVYGPDYTGLPEVFEDSALLLVFYSDNTASSTLSVDIEISHIDPTA